ncbi:MAG: hypothetical protein HYX25_08515 [Candidatus Solibacter usitatus]|nr:hypothetical protein [Candidatus Solibacter usitatus]
MKRWPSRLGLAAAIFAATALAQKADSDVILRAMRDELHRSLGLRLQNLDAPYFISYEIGDGDFFSASATLGALVGANHTRLRIPRVQVRVGNYDFDNTNYIGSGFIPGSRYDVERFPQDDDYLLLRRFLWLSTDQTFKAAVDAISRKRSALKNLSASDSPLADFARAEPNRLIQDVVRTPFDEAPWLARVRSLSLEFARYPEIASSSVEYSANRNIRYLVTSEETEVRLPEGFIQLRARAAGLAADGMRVRDTVAFLSLDPGRMPKDSEMTREILRLGENVSALTKAPVGESYSGPVLFEGAAGPQIVSELIGRNLALTRKPVTEPGRPGAFASAELEGRQGARILPEWLDVIDDPAQTEWHGRPLIGHYRVDEEGVAPKPLTLVEKGILKNYLLTRLPMRGYSGSNGRARLPANFGTEAAAASNLIVRAKKTTPLPKLKKKMMDLCKARSKPYGIIVRKMDFPSSASVDEARRIIAGQSGGGRPVSLPVLVYRLYPDGREELVRGLHFKGMNARSLKDIVGASDENTVFEFLENGAPFALLGAGNYAAESSVIAPSLLVDDLELVRTEEEFPRPPVAPAPGFQSK